jgi:hypothetical protein
MKYMDCVKPDSLRSSLGRSALGRSVDAYETSKRTHEGISFL